MTDYAPAPLSTSRTVFVGNIPYYATEQQVRDILNTVGPLQSLRLVNDAKTGKPKGYGFAEYLDAHTAQSAIRNLNNYDLNGRSLRVDLADDDNKGSGGGTARRAPAAAPLSSSSTQHSNQHNTAQHTARFTLGSQQPPDTHNSLPFTPATVTHILTTLSSSQRVDLLLEMRRLSASNPEACRLLLMENPALAHLMLQCQLAFGLVAADQVAALVRGSTAPDTAMTAPQPSSVQQQQQSMPLPPPPPQPQQPPPVYAAPPAGYYQPPPVPSMPLPPPPSAAAYPSADDILSRLPPLPPQQREILVELLRLTPDELRGLPMEAQQQVKDILQKMGIGR